MLGLLVLVMAALVPAARADAFTCQYAQAGADPGAGESAFFFLSCTVVARVLLGRRVAGRAMPPATAATRSTARCGSRARQ
jgi:hypothetical protein